MINKDIEIKINKATRMVFLSKKVIGNDAENLQQRLVFTFEDEFVEGQARLEYKIDEQKKWAVAQREGESYVLPVKSIMTKEGNIFMQLVITEGTDINAIPIFKSNVFYLYCGESINTIIDEPDQFPTWLEIANTKLNQVDNLDIDATQKEKGGIVTITKKDKTQKSVELNDGTTYTPSLANNGDLSWTNDMGKPNPETKNIKGPKGDKGDKGDTYVLTDQDKTEIANETKEIVMPDLQKEITLVEDKAGNRITLAINKNYLMTLKLLNSKGKELSTASVDLPLETMVVNARYDNATKELVIVLENGNELKVPIGGLIKGLVNQDAFDKAVQALQEQITANNDELNHLVGEVSDIKQQQGLFKQEQTLQNKAIQKNVDDIITTNKEVTYNTKRIKVLESNIFDSGVAEGTDFINIKDSALAEFQDVELNVSKAQDTTNGYQLLDIKDSTLTTAGITTTIKNNHIKMSGVATNTYWEMTGNLPYDKNIEGGTCTLSISNSSKYRISFTTYDESGQVKNVIQARSTKVTFEFKPYAIKPEFFLLLGGAEIGETVDEEFDIQLERGEVAHKVEPYTGGVASPNPDYPQEIDKKAGSFDFTSCGKNLFDKETALTDLRIAIDGGEFRDVQSVLSDYIVALPNTNYAVNYKVNAYTRIGFYDKDKIFISGNDKIQVFKTPNGTKYIRLGVLKTDKDKALLYELEKAITNTIGLGENELLPGDKVDLRFNPMTGKYEKILKKNSDKKTFDGTETWEFQNGVFTTNIDKIRKDKEYQKYKIIISNYFLGDTTRYRDGFVDYTIAKAIDASKPLQIGIKSSNFTLEQFKAKLQEWNTNGNPLEAIYELADEFKTEINLGEIDIMNMTYYPTTNAFTSVDNLFIRAKYYRDFVNTIANLQLGEKTLKAQIEESNKAIVSHEQRLQALEKSIVSASEEVVANA